MSLAVLFPGQGSQFPGYLRALSDNPTIRDAVAYSDLDSADALRDTANVQVGLLIAGVACARALKAEAGVTPQFVAGHSVGAFAAAVTAGALTLAEAIDIVSLRAHLMKQACAEGHWGMGAVTGLSSRKTQEVVEQVRTPDHPLWLANLNSATQCVVSGTVDAISRFSEASRAAGATACDVLDVSVASHCPLQDGTAIELAKRMAAIPRRPLTAGYLTNSRGRRVSDASAVLTDLAESVARPVRWYDIARLLPELGVTCAVEVPPGHVLTRLMAAAAPSVTAVAMSIEGLTQSAIRCQG